MKTGLTYTEQGIKFYVDIFKNKKVPVLYKEDIIVRNIRRDPKTKETIAEIERVPNAPTIKEYAFDITKDGEYFATLKIHQDILLQSDGIVTMLRQLIDTYPGILKYTHSLFVITNQSPIRI